MAGICFLVAYRVYGRLLARLLRLDSGAKTPAVEMRDDVDYVPIEPKFLLGQHFSAIAAAGPIVGPILAGLYFGWLPALIWIILGAIFIGGVHDTASLVASIRHKARSIAEVVRDHMTRRAYLLFLSFIWIALVYIIVAFADITATSFVGKQVLESGKEVYGGGIATSSILYLLLPLAMGLLMRFTNLTLGWATFFFLPLVGFVIWLGQYLPFDLAALLGTSDDVAQKVWAVLILLYCLLAAVLPMWLLLQPRGHLGGYFLYFGLLVGILGITFSGNTVQYPAFTGWSTAKGETLVPILFITVACGACSGFHALIASGTTSKQLRRETDAKLIGYGTMLMEGMVAVIALSCVMMLTKNAAILQNPKPNFIFAAGIGSYLERVHIPATFAVSIMLMAFTTFVYDTLDVCTRLGRYIIQELTGWHNAAGRWLGTVLTAGVPLLFVMQKTHDMTGKLIPAWQLFWGLFGASNQLLAALTLLGITVWLWRTYRAKWVWLVTGLPTIWMYVMSVWALTSMVVRAFMGGSYLNPVPWVALVLVGLAVLMLLEALRVFTRTRSAPPQPEPVAVG